MDTKLLKHKILDLAIHGKLVPQNPNDESATVLLEKIRAEKAEKIKKGELKADKKDSFIFVGDDNRHYEKVFAGGKTADGTVKDIEDEIPFEVPEGWAWCKAKQLYNIRSAIRIHQSDWQSNGIPFFRGRELVELCKTGTVHPEIFISEELYEENKKKGGLPQKNDLLVSAVGTLGFVHIVEGTKKFYYKDAYILCFENHFNLNPFYMKKVIESDFIQKVIYGGSKGTTVDQLTIENAKDLWIPFPPENEQKKLVSELDRLFLLIDSIEKDKLDLQTAIKQAKSKILDLAIHGKLVPQDANDEPASVLLEKLRVEKEEKIAKGELKRDKNDSFIYKDSDNCHYQRFADGHEEDISEEIHCELPESWAWCRIKDICTINPKNKLDDNLEVSFIPMTLIDAGYTNHHGQETRVWKKIKTGFTHFAENDVAIAKISPCFENKKSVILKNLKNGYGAGTTELYILRACSIVLPEYLFWIVKTDSFINEGVGNFSGVVGQQRLARDIVENYYIPLPPINEQKRIISKIVSLFEKLDIIDNNIE